MAKRKKVDAYKYIKVLALLSILSLLVYFGISSLLKMSKKTLKVTTLSCTSAQVPRAFGKNVIYMEGDNLNCVSSDGKFLWSTKIGKGFDFHASENYVAAWTNSGVRVFDRNGRESYAGSSNTKLSDDDDSTSGVSAGRVMFARMGKKWLAYATETADGYNINIMNSRGDTLIKTVEHKNFEDGNLLDMGFFEGRVRLWYTTMKAMHPVASTFIYFQDQASDGGNRGLSQTSVTEIGEELYYKVVNGAGKLNIVGTKEIKRYDESLSNSKLPNQNVLVYGWQCIDSFTDGGEARLLFAPLATLNDEKKAGNLISELRLIVGMKDYRYALPEECVGAMTDGSKIYAFSHRNVYYASIKDKRFKPMKLEVDEDITALLDKTTDGRAILGSSNKTYVVDLP